MESKDYIHTTNILNQHHNNIQFIVHHRTQKEQSNSSPSEICTTFISAN
ncbi:hypothetical protein T4D_5871 [Trichinella pseudospiralis]|uniref:Uncharacterized protein n=1 Tax=Trichinella pseudospiralis TaxID=6337 RepID=A0A0V1F2K2_TRIPS|nr:hypothetical protein T4D_5871 [Trichinella pseudospiralis]